MTRADRLERIKFAIETIERSIKTRAEAHGDPTSSSTQRAYASSMIGHYEDEFCWQWQNVKAVLFGDGADSGVE